MYVRIYQARENSPVFLRGYDSVYRELARPMDEFYRLAWQGEINASNLEKMVELLNRHLPHDFKGRSVSVSDIVWTPANRWYVDTVGFRELRNWECSCLAKRGDKVCCQGIVVTIKDIEYQDWNKGYGYDMEFTDTQGVYRSWKQWCDGGYLIVS